MVERPRKDVTDGKSWKCPQCKTRNSIREGSFFSKLRMSLQKWLLIIYHWARDYPVTDAAQEVELTKTSAIDVFQWLENYAQRSSSKTKSFLGVLGQLCKSMNPFSGTNQRCVIL